MTSLLAGCDNLKIPAPGGFYFGGATSKNYAVGDLLRSNQCFVVTKASNAIKTLVGKTVCMFYTLGNKYAVTSSKGFPGVAKHGVYRYTVSPSQMTQAMLTIKKAKWPLKLTMAFKGAMQGVFKATLMRKYKFSGTFVIKLQSQKVE